MFKTAWFLIILAIQDFSNPIVVCCVMGLYILVKIYSFYYSKKIMSLQLIIFIRFYRPFRLHKYSQTAFYLRFETVMFVITIVRYFFRLCLCWLSHTKYVCLRARMCFRHPHLHYVPYTQHRLTTRISYVSNTFQNKNSPIHEIVCVSPPQYYLYCFEIS